MLTIPDGGAETRCAPARWRLRCGFFGAPLFVASLLVFGSLHPGYSNYTRAVSELGALGVPVGPWFNLFGLLLPGLLGTAVAWEFRRAVSGAGLPTRWCTGLLIYTTMLALTCIPADFQRMFASPWTWVHAFFVLTSPLVLFVVIPGCARNLRLLGVGRLAVGGFVALGYGPVGEFLLYAVMRRALVQRLTIVTVHLAMAWLGWTLLQRERRVGSG
jgi:hypothetical protein